MVHIEHLVIIFAVPLGLGVAVAIAVEMMELCSNNRP